MALPVVMDLQSHREQRIAADLRRALHEETVAGAIRWGVGTSSQRTVLSGRCG
jgi:hypothetical protein